LRKTILLLARIITVALFVCAHTAHSSAGQHPHDHEQRGQQRPQQSEAPTLDDLRAKNFTVRTIDGQTVNLNTLLGEGKPVLIDFWATWCGPCRMVIPHLTELSRKYGKDGLVVIGLNLESPRTQAQAVRNFVRRYKMDYQNVFAPHAIYQFFSGMAVARVPYTLLFDADGTLTWRLVGYSPQIGASLNSAVEKAMAGAQSKQADQGAQEKRAEQGAPEKQTEQKEPEKRTEQREPEKPVEQSAPEKPAELGAPEKPAEQEAPVKPEEQEGPKSKTCTCDCPRCSSHAPEKQTDGGSPPRPAER
jgi:cytochrome c biogenesis protein CcmG, thiol:disulfide interchange protein DsbE